MFPLTSDSKISGSTTSNNMVLSCSLQLIPEEIIQVPRFSPEIVCLGRLKNCFEKFGT